VRSVGPVVGAEAAAFDVGHEHLGVGPLGVRGDALFLGGAASCLADLDDDVLGEGAVLLEVDDVGPEGNVDGGREVVDAGLDGGGEGPMGPIAPGGGGGGG